MSVMTKAPNVKGLKIAVIAIALAFCVVASGGCFKSETPGQATKEDLATASQISYKIENLHHSLIDEEKAEADVIVPLGLSKEQIMSVCRSSVVDIEKRCETELKEVNLDVFHENTANLSKAGFTCARYILDRRGKRQESETIAYYDYYFTPREDYQIEGLSQSKAIQLWHDLIRAERKHGVSTPEYFETEKTLYQKYGVDIKNKNKLLTWSMVDQFGLPEK